MSKVFVVSLHRSATQSTARFLQDAGYRTCHWAAVVDGVDYQRQVAGLETQPERILEILRPVVDAHDALADVPTQAIFRQLDAAYPGSRFIAVHRSPFAWVRSVRKHCAGRRLHPYERAQYWCYLTDKPETLDAVSDERLVDLHLQHHGQLASHFSGTNRLLIADLDDAAIGEKLSTFLGTAARSFPSVDYKRSQRVCKTDRHRFHILGVPHTVSAPDYSACAFTQKIVRMCAMLKDRGHYVVHYGHEHSKIVCDEHVAVTDDGSLRTSYGDHDWKVQGPPNSALSDPIYREFDERAIAALKTRCKPGDFLLCMYGAGHRKVADAFPDLIVCEPGIGYAQGHFAPYKVFESYAVLHAYLGLASVAKARNNLWYHVVIPNYFNLEDFEYRERKEDYFLFLGRVDGGKGVHIAMQIAEATGTRLVVAGPGTIEGMGTRTSRPVADYVEQVGVVGPAERRRLLAGARAAIVPTLFAEPFCGVQIEAMLSGTPVISTDWGAFAEYNLHGLTGYRCRTFEQFVWAARNIDKIRPAACREWAASNFSVERVAELYDEFFFMLKAQTAGGGWYAENPKRDELDWLAKEYPTFRRVNGKNRV